MPAQKLPVLKTDKLNSLENLKKDISNSNIASDIEAKAQCTFPNLQIDPIQQSQCPVPDLTAINAAFTKIENNFNSLSTQYDANFNEIETAINNMTNNINGILSKLACLCQNPGTQLQTISLCDNGPGPAQFDF